MLPGAPKGVNAAVVIVILNPVGNGKSAITSTRKDGAALLPDAGPA
jgi:hypothetical protein